ncbi:hypothetical protein GCM10020220_094200 [Nonomuraea rubra]
MRSAYVSAWATDHAATSHPRFFVVIAVLPIALASSLRASAVRACGAGVLSEGYQQCTAFGTRPVKAAARIFASVSCGAYAYPPAERCTACAASASGIFR